MQKNSEDIDIIYILENFFLFFFCTYIPTEKNFFVNIIIINKIDIILPHMLWRYFSECK